MFAFLFSQLGRSTACPWYAQIGAAVAGLLVLFGMQVASQPAGGSNAPAASQSVAHAASAVSATAIADGEEVYNRLCRSCHQANGQGVPGTFPPLNGTQWVNGDEGRLIRLLLHGLAGPIQVKGQTYTGAMPPWGGTLSDKEVAQVATYTRTNFGNDASPITAEQVSKVRKATEGRSKPWTAKELNKKANQGIPGGSSGGE